MKAEQERIMKEQEAMMMAKYGAALFNLIGPGLLRLIMRRGDVRTFFAGGMKPKKKGAAALPKVNIRRYRFHAKTLDRLLKIFRRTPVSMPFSHGRITNTSILLIGR